MVNASLTTIVRSRATDPCYRTAMDTPFIHGRLSLADAAELIDRFGDAAGYEAAARAERSRDDGNVARFCHWRQIERVIATLRRDEAFGTVH